MARPPSPTSNGKITIGEIIHGELTVSFFYQKSFAYGHWRMSCTRRVVTTEHLVARTFFSVLSCRARLSTYNLHTHMRAAQDVTGDVLSFCAHKTLLGVPDTFSSFCSSPPQTKATSRPLAGIRGTPCATSPEGRQSGHLAEPHPHTGHEPKSCIDVSSEHTPINYFARRNSSNIEIDPTTPVAASETLDGFHQQATASDCSPHVPASEVNPWLSADLWSRTRKLVRGRVSNVSVEETLTKGKRDRDLESVLQTLSEGNIHMSTSSRMLNWLFEENAQLRDHCHLTESDYRKSGCGFYFFELIHTREIRNLMRDVIVF